MSAKSIVAAFRAALKLKDQEERDPTLAEWRDFYGANPIPITEDEDFELLDKGIHEALQKNMATGERDPAWFDGDIYQWAAVVHNPKDSPFRNNWVVTGVSLFGGTGGQILSATITTLFDEELWGADAGILSYFRKKSKELKEGKFNWNSKHGRVFLYLIHGYMNYYEIQRKVDLHKGKDSWWLFSGGTSEDDIVDAIAYSRFLFRQASVQAPGIWPQPQLGKIDESIRADFNYKKFGTDATTLINSYMDGQNLKEGQVGWKITGVDFASERVDGSGKKEYYLHHIKGVIKQDDIQKLKTDGAMPEDNLVELVKESRGIASQFVIPKESVLVDFRRIDVLDYADPWPEIEEEKHTIRLSGPIYDVKIIGLEKKKTLDYWVSKFCGWNPSAPTSKPAKAYDVWVANVIHEQLDDIRLEADSPLYIYQRPEENPTPAAVWQEEWDKAIKEVAGRDGAEEDQYENLEISSFLGSVRVGYDLAQLILNALRLEAWNKIAQTLENVDPGVKSDQAAINKLAARDVNEAQKEFKDKHADKLSGKTDKAYMEKRQLSEKQIADRQKFIKQCALMSQMPWMMRQNRKLINRRQGIHKAGVYGNRFYLLDSDGDRLRIPSKLLIPKEEQIKPFLEMTPDIHAFLVPKLRLFKVYGKGKDIREIEFFFENFIKPSDVAVNTIGETYDKGHGAGIKSFSFNFQGTTPATARNDIEANLVLFFQSFDDFVVKRTFKPNQGKHAYVDLLLLPVQEESQPYLDISPIQNDIANYRIRADVGWIINAEGYTAFEQTIKTRFGEKYSLSKFNQALAIINKSYYLNMVDHELDIKEDGTVEIKASYRAYVESLLKGSEMDALSTRELRKRRQVFRDEYKEKISQANCSERQLQPIRRNMLEQEKAIIKDSYRSIVDRMACNGLIYYVNAHPTDMQNYAQTGVLTKAVRFQKPTESGAPPSKGKKKVDSAKTKMNDVKSARGTVNYSLDTGYQFVNTSVESQWTTVNFFFLGDLLYTILDCVVENKSRLANFKMLLSSFNYDDLFGNGTTVKFANLADIPVSVDYFFEWYTNNVIKTERLNYPVMYFIRDLCRDLITNVMSDNCFKVDINKALTFQTAHFLSLGNPFAEAKKSIKNGTYLVDRMHNSNALPFSNDAASGHLDISKFYNFLLIYPLQPSRAHGGTGNRIKDGSIGTYHYQLGSINGIVKNMKFAKTDIKYLREARFFRNGNDGMMQLGNVYKVTLDMIGNTLYYPGMEFYVDPAGIGKGNQWNPTIPGSVANALGIGGYHLVTKVTSQIAPGKFTTSVEGQFIFSGDGRQRRMVDGVSSAPDGSNVKDKRSKACAVHVESAYKSQVGGN